MTHDLHTRAQGVSPVRTHPCPSGNPDHLILELSDDEARLAGLSPGHLIHVDRSRQPSTGDLVWVELVRHGSTQRLVRRYALDGGWVTLGTPGSTSAAIMRRRAELLVLGVVDDGARCAVAPN